MYSRVNSNLLEDRLDAEFYSLEQIKNHKTLQDYGVILTCSPLISTPRC